MNKRAEGMIRARVRRQGKAVELGYFETKEEVAAAQEVAHAILDEWDAVKNDTPKLPSPNTLIRMIDQGFYDLTIDALAAVVIQRKQMFKQMETKTGRFDPLDATKWQALQRKSRQGKF
jgi:hypothetical protein